MKRYLFPVVVAAALSGATLAQAADIEGTITQVDVDAHTITLENNDDYVLEESTDISQFEVGETVLITYEDHEGINRATAIEEK